MIPVALIAIGFVALLVLLVLAIVQLTLAVQKLTQKIDECNQATHQQNCNAEAPNDIEEGDWWKKGGKPPFEEEGDD